MVRKTEGTRPRDTVIFKSRLGWVGLAVTESGICEVVLPKKHKSAVEQELGATTARISPGKKRIFSRAIKVLRRYFSGERVLLDLPLDIRSYTPFQRAVWRTAAEIPSGETRSYAWIAKRIKKPRSSRAVGQALGANPVPVIIPCHRVISSSGTLGGFSGGLGMKKKLLAMEESKPFTAKAPRSRRKTKFNL